MLTRNPERLAWITLLAAQLVCLIFAFTSMGSGWWFFFASSTSLDTQIKVGQGSIGVYASANAQEQSVRLSREVSAGEIIRTAQGDQGNLQFIDSRLDKVIATVTIFPDSQVRLVSARRPRFGFTNADYRINLNDVSGRIEIRIAPDIDERFVLVAKGTFAEVHLTEPGLYSLTSDTTRTALWARNADGEIRPYQGSSTRVFAGYSGIVDANQEIAVVVEAYDVLTRDSLFMNPDQPGGWACYPGFNTYDHQVIDARHTMYLLRPNVGSEIAGCRQNFGEGGAGWDVTGYRSLRVRATVRITDQSVRICGQEGSECPLMLEITYINQYGVEDEWYYHGFYSDFPPATYLFDLVNRTTCATCLTEHDRIMAGNWFTFESQNLLELPADFRPIQIKQIHFYSSGHRYEVAIGEVSLIGER